MVTIKAYELKSFWSKLIGLLGSEKPYPVFFKTRLGIHTFGMKFPIDILILDNDYKIAKLTEMLKPNKIFFWDPIYDKVIELPAGEIKKYKLKLRDKINLIIKHSLTLYNQ